MRQDTDAKVKVAQDGPVWEGNRVSRSNTSVIISRLVRRCNLSDLDILTLGISILVSVQVAPAADDP